MKGIWCPDINTRQIDTSYAGERENGDCVAPTFSKRGNWGQKFLFIIS